MTTTTNATMTQSTTLVQSLPTGVQGNPRTCTVLSERDVHSSVDCSQPFCSPFRCSWWFGRTQDNATTRQSAFCVAGPVAWNSLPLDIRSAPTLSSFKNMLKTSFVTFLLHWLFPEYEQRTLYGDLVVTLAILLHLINCRFIISLHSHATAGYCRHSCSSDHTSIPVPVHKNLTSLSGACCTNRLTAVFNQLMLLTTWE